MDRELMKSIMSHIDRTDETYGKGGTPLLAEDFRHLHASKYALTKALSTLVGEGKLKVGKWGRKNSWTSA